MTQVLVVDDSLTLRQLIRAILEPAGYYLIEASDGVEGLEMPNLDGMGVLQAVTDSGGPLLAHDYIVISANQATFPSVFIDLLRHLSIRVLAKPFERDVLLATVEQAAERLATPATGELPPEDGTDAE
jgi:CheY-like chemotaxis protein